MADEKSQQLNFESALAELKGLVEKMEQGGLPLQDSLQYFEQGVGLIRHCQQELAAAEQKVKILTEQSKLEPYQTDEN
jgi:exodeoxyribonuclease VII small subunit